MIDIVRMKSGFAYVRTMFDPIDKIFRTESHPCDNDLFVDFSKSYVAAGCATEKEAESNHSFIISFLKER